MLNILEEKLSPLNKEGTLTINTGLAVLPTDLYKLGTVYTSSGAEIEQVSRNEFLSLNASKLTIPTVDYPVYINTTTAGANSVPALKIYPSSLVGTGTISCSYIKKPNKVNWAYVVINEKALYNALNSTNFELHKSEETNIVYRILTLAGISFEDAGLNVRAASVQEETRRIQQEKN